MNKRGLDEAITTTVSALSDDRLLERTKELSGIEHHLEVVVVDTCARFRSAACTCALASPACSITRCANSATATPRHGGASRRCGSARTAPSRLRRRRRRRPRLAALRQRSRRPTRTAPSGLRRRRRGPPRLAAPRRQRSTRLARTAPLLRRRRYRLSRRLSRETKPLTARTLRQRSRRRRRGPKLRRRRRAA